MFGNQWRVLLGGAALCATLAGAVSAQTDIAAQREAFMKGMGGKVAVLVGMAQGRTAYDAAAATAAAGELQGFAEQDWAPLFPAGSDADTLGKGKSLPKIWQNMDDFVAHQQKLASAAAALSAVAGDGLEALKANVGAIGAACGSCHEVYRK